MPTILGHNPPHDSALCCVRDGTLLMLVEAEKDNRVRHHAVMGLPRVLDVLAGLDSWPDAIGFSGLGNEGGDGFPGPYIGTARSAAAVRPTRVFGREIHLVHTSHERAHVMCGYGMSPFPQAQPCYVLNWEGSLGTFYVIDDSLEITPLGTPLSHPGLRYAAPFALAQNAGCGVDDAWALDLAGKMMALAGGGVRPAPGEWADDVGRFLVEAELSERASVARLLDDWRDFSLAGAGTDTSPFRSFARAFSDALFERYLRFAVARLTRGLPLIIVGGCALNCEWNRRWRACGLFADVFVPPCPNDSGVSLGAAIDAQFALTGDAKIRWNVYAGESFAIDCVETPGFTRDVMDPPGVARMLAGGAVLAWVQGRYEIGPRALGNRSLLASPLLPQSRERLNAVKRREAYRPVAPVCAEESASRWFDLDRPSPHMLFLADVRDPRLVAVRHADGSARVQTLSYDQNPALHGLLGAFEVVTGVSVLCNTSLNRTGAGFINRLSDLASFAAERELDGFVVGNAWYRRTG